MNDSYRNKRFSQEVEDASEDGMGMRSKINSRRSIIAREGLMASVVKAASAFNNVLLENCGICTVYCDKQVQYEEYVQQQYEVGVGAMEHLYSQLNPSAASTTNPIKSAAALGIDHSCFDIDSDNDAHSSTFINHSEMKTPPNKNNNGATNPTTNNNKQIETERYYREFLFDEESVVRSVGSRGATDDE
mmetsp:Transcript_9621/g.20847  ORF Transcript_9621/g.20847 Transcript_9621/m.20847 type:complete len:189 (-) Transcript_9621:274-840(-)|eukprot:CAMPEP_0168203968 /NCGR_PEP_ID=MMETSP0139_2-20121125/25146_1 /TAXON_ID=44445 /ORGANISM="Pseudo-nitzschia australis, Strain 10249 10 AB" /LENGTH=188 /DNA_ID=CAMNT_0008129873 /DNA_START=195 /DNA_END=764 /DNA_ORIENTATION=-